jgi:ferritin
MVFGFINKGFSHMQTGYKNILKHGTAAKKLFHTVDHHVNNFNRFYHHVSPRIREISHEARVADDVVKRAQNHYENARSHVENLAQVAHHAHDSVVGGLNKTGYRIA